MYIYSYTQVYKRLCDMIPLRDSAFEQSKSSNSDELSSTLSKLIDTSKEIEERILANVLDCVRLSKEAPTTLICKNDEGV